MPTSYTLTGDLDDLLGGAAVVATAKARLDTNLPPTDALVDTTGKKVRLGTGPVAIESDGTFTVAGLIGSDSTDLNIEAGTLQYQLVVEYRDPGVGGSVKRVWRSGWFALTATSDIADVPRSVTPAVAATGAEIITAASAEADRAEAAAEAATAPTDTQMAAKVQDPQSETGQALSATYAARSRRRVLDPQVRIKQVGAMPRTVSLVAGQDDETFSTVGATVALDTAHTKINGRAWKVTSDGARTNAAINMTPIPPAATAPLPLPSPPQAVCLWVYVHDASLVNSISVSLDEDSGATLRWTRANISDAWNPPLVTGWNFLRFKMVTGLPAAWTGTQLHMARVIFDCTAATSITIGHLYLECPEKARLLFVADRGYKSLVDLGLDRIRAVGMPVTWAVDVLKFGQNVGTAAEAVTEEQMAQFYAEGDSVSFHGYTAEPTSTMTDPELRADTIKCIKWLQSRGYEGRMWRAAWVQDNSPNPDAIKDLVLAQAQSSVPSVQMDIWPPADMMNIPRWNLYGKTEAQTTSQFALLKKTRGFLVPYNHGINDAGGNDATLSRWDNFMTEVETGVADGWLECVTFEQLFHESGGKFHTLGGATVAEYTDASGRRVTKTIL